MISNPVSRGGSSEDATSRHDRGASFSESILSGASEPRSRPTSGTNKPLPGPPVPEKEKQKEKEEGKEKEDDGFQTEEVVGSKDKLPGVNPHLEGNSVTTKE
jgi:hypothetical protein